MSQDETATADPSFVPRFSEAPVGAVLGGVAAVMSSIGTLCIGGLMALVVADVLGRNFFNAPITGVAEIAARTVVAIVFLQVAAAILQRRLTRADFLVRRLERASPRLVLLLEALFALCGAVVFALILWASWPKMMDAWTGAEFFGVQGVFTIPTFPFRAITVLGSAVAALSALYRCTEEIRSFQRGAQ
ncbi:TRAP transporter small permease subunit [Puniceibacterium sp. IMCC21224]|uniref:TRAP transporter small permease subunit n=1 Tax=Puniceibacterium sp. IMCC21224 TaxID=1618204 RepID=UPI00064D83B9|nr:TRAP transporter small permease [Puniceibacterium sp. IMCC21224]KMK66139.1 Tripartite ATP-independent periplasmic transporter, DctQ component [Puniceibacterium sp. IMCC21224]